MQYRREKREMSIKTGEVFIISPGKEEKYPIKILNESVNGFGFCSDLEISGDHLVKILVDDNEYICSIIWRKRIDDPDLGSYHYGVEIESR